MTESKLSEEVIDKLNQMQFRELKELIENCLKSENGKLSQEFNTNDPELLKEYAILLETKIISIPVSPQIFNAKNFIKSESYLANFTAKSEELKKDLNRTYFHLKTAEEKRNWKLVNALQKSFDKLKKAIEDREKSEKYLEAIKEKERKLVEYKTFLKEKEEYQLKLEAFKIQHRILERIRISIENIDRPNFQLTKLNWELLPTDERSFKKLKDYLQTIPKLSDVEFDFERLDKIISLDADEIYFGIDEFEGYLVFYFGKIKVAVLDCPVKGNAIYILDEDWKNLSRLSKSKLLNFYSNKTKRIIHKGDWFEKLKSLLKTHYEN